MPQTAQATLNHSDTKHLGETQAGCHQLKSPSRGRQVHASTGKAGERDLPAVTLHTKQGKTLQGPPSSQLCLPKAKRASSQAAAVESGRGSALQKGDVGSCHQPPPVLGKWGSKSRPWPLTSLTHTTSSASLPSCPAEAKTSAKGRGSYCKSSKVFL